MAFSGAASGNADLWTLPVDLTGGTLRKTGEPQVCLRTPSNEGTPRFSPDGRWLAYTSNESGQQEAYVRPYPGPGGKVQISNDGVQGAPGGGLVWAPDGKEIVYLNLKRQLMAVAYAASGSSFAASKPRLVSSVEIQGSLEDIAPDGKSFAVITTSEAGSRPEVTFVVNFFEELRRIAPRK